MYRTVDQVRNAAAENQGYGNIQSSRISVSVNKQKNQYDQQDQSVEYRNDNGMIPEKSESNACVLNISQVENMRNERKFMTVG